MVVARGGGETKPRNGARIRKKAASLIPFEARDPELSAAQSHAFFLCPLQKGHVATAATVTNPRGSARI
jgi:hypothetical protein